MSEKQEVLAKVEAQIRAQYERMAAAVQSSVEYATDQDSKAESKYDTRGLEASYLAAGQAEQVEELSEALQMFETWDLPDLEEDSAIEVGALVEADAEGELVFYLIATKGGGVVCEHEGCDLTVLTPDSPLGAKLLGMRAGDLIEKPAITIFTVS
ncbi:MAG: transcription elongation factor GreAB [Verrucomicrobiota bacterium]